MYFALNFKELNKQSSFSFSKDAIAEKLNLKEEEKPHRALNGVNHLILCYEKLIGFS